MKYDKITLLFVIILVAGIFLRIYNLNWTTFGYGEIEVYQSVQEFLKGNFTHNFYIFAETPLMKYIFTLFAFLMQPAEIALRLVSVIFGSLTVIGVFFLAKKLYNDNYVALLSSIFTAFSIIHITLSRYVQLEAQLSFFYIIVFYIFWIFLEKRTNKNAILLGIVLALGILTKTAFLNAIITLLFLAIILRLISFRLKPNSSISVDNKLLKALIVSILVFFL